MLTNLKTLHWLGGVQEKNIKIKGGVKSYICITLFLLVGLRNNFCFKKCWGKIFLCYLIFSL